MTEHWMELLSVRAAHAVYLSGAESIDELSQLSEADLLSRKGVGRKTLKELRELLSSYDLSFRDGPRILREDEEPPKWLPASPDESAWGIDGHGHIFLIDDKNNRRRRFVPGCSSAASKIRREVAILTTLLSAYAAARKAGAVD